MSKKKHTSLGLAVSDMYAKEKGTMRDDMPKIRHERELNWIKKGIEAGHYGRKRVSEQHKGL